MRVIAVANQKGGCGKTTTSINLAACLAHLGKQTLLVDLDPQGHSTCGLGVQLEKGALTLYDLLGFREALRPSVMPILKQVNSCLYLLPSDGVLNALEEDLANSPDRDKRLKRELDILERENPDFEYVILDCPPNLGVLTFNALEAADDLIIPIEPSFFSLHGLAKISETIQHLQIFRETRLNVYALLTLFDSDTTFGQEIYEEVLAHFQDQLLRTVIHNAIVLKEASSAGQSIVEYAPESSAFRDYFHLAVEYLKRDWQRRFPMNELGWKNILHRHYGPRSVLGGVLFQAINEKAEIVEIAGDFNQWIPEAMQKRPNGLWQKVIPIHPGKYRYKFIVDGEWQIDPYQPVQRQNEYGTVDSYLELV
ncbi:MAG: AAA family ATPase [Candidatus Omnitrophica bacterium]|nr:AAA family ATPase [Candidatus Omnitrophota bacterium]